ncbi:EKC/KEOPS complex subunit LAGE3 [Athene noctua]|uniref:EKC/KEOPS complex subunit LAGE3 n=1 Tax=Athene noctua TaxID=126797 RepID=UPI003EB885C1
MRVKREGQSVARAPEVGGGGKMAAETGELELRLRVPLPSAGVGRVALGALRPDLPLPPPAGGPPRPHPPPSAQLQCCGGELRARWAGPGARALRGGAVAFLELLGLVLETIERFGGEGPGHALLGPEGGATGQAPPPAPPPSTSPAPHPQ